MSRPRTESQLERFDPNRQAINDAVAHANWAEKKWTWVPDAEEGYLAAYIVREDGDKVTVKLASNEAVERVVAVDDCQKMNPPKFDKVEDMADLTYLNEASVIHNLRLRYFSNLIYTYSGLFLVAVNPYTKLPLYTDEVVKSYRNKRRNEMAPHIYAISDHAYYTMQQEHENQSILITGESGAGKTENTKKVIQYITAIASHAAAAAPAGSRLGPLEQQIIQTNPILEAFGNAQTIRNNNSSRFGKFIRIEFTPGGQIAGANLERYLLEKSRVTFQSPKERNYHIFYQLLKGGSDALKREVLLDGLTLNDFRYTKKSNKNIEGVDDQADFMLVQEAFRVVGFSDSESLDLYRMVAAVLYLGNITSVAGADDQAQINDTSVCEKVCHLLGVPVKEFVQGLVKPTIKAGREWIVASRTVEQLQYSVDALARAMYERSFGRMIERLNEALYTSKSRSNYIGVLDIAGFEIFELNSFEQLLINYTNERLQQFFNHHMFILEQEEYRREGIEWKFIDFGMDLQPTIDLIEKTTPIGILSLLDEECVMPKATDKTFTEKLHQLWKGKSTKYEQPRFNQGFILHHYADRVEYSTEGWLDKNKDPLNETVTRLLAQSTHKHVAELFEDALGEDDISRSKKASILKKGAFRTVAQRHKEQLVTLMNQLYSTTPHFVRCILPNDEKKPRLLRVNMVLEQLRCNGVLEGIRICRQGFPNRVPFAEFRQRYEILAPGVIPRGFFDGRQAAAQILEKLSLDKNQYRLGSSKVFFRAGVLAELEEIRDARLSLMITRIQALVRGFLARRAYARLTKYQTAIRTIQKNARVYVALRTWAWWRLYSKVKPLLNVSRIDEEMRRKDAIIQGLEQAKSREEEERRKLEASRAQLEQEKRNIEGLLISEKNAASEQQELLLRTQTSRAQLEDALKTTQGELERVQQQLEEAGQNARKLDAQLRERQAQLEAAEALGERLERDRQTREQQLEQLSSELRLQSEQAGRLEGDKRSLEQQLGDARRALEDSDAKVAELTKAKSKLQGHVQELEERGQDQETERRRLDDRREQLETSGRAVREELAELTRVKAELEQQLQRRTHESSELSERLSRETADREAADRERRELASRAQELAADLTTEKTERERVHKLKSKLETELAQLTDVMQQKGDEESKQSELRRLRESELAELRSQLAATQAELDELRRAAAVAQEKLRFELEDVRQDAEQTRQRRAETERALANLQGELESATERANKLDKTRRQLELDVQTARSQSEDTEAALGELRAARESAERQLAAATTRADERDAEVSRLERERASLSKQLETTRAEVEDEVRRRQHAEQARKKTSTEVDELTARLEEETLKNEEAQRKLAQKSTESDQLREKLNSEVLVKLGESEDKLRRAEKDQADLRQRVEELDRTNTSLEKSKARLVNEIEDLHHEIEREHNVARNAERLAKQLENQLATVNANVELELKQRELAESTARKLQMQLDGMTAQLAEREDALQQLQRSKGEMESELKSLVDEIGEGGRNIHELEKTKRRLDARVEELSQQLEEEAALRKTLEDAKTRADADFTEARRKMEADLLEKDTLMEDTRRMLLKEVNALGEQLDEQIAVKNDLLKQRKRLEEALEEATSRAESTSKNQGEADKLRRRLEQVTKDLTGKLEAEEQTRRNLEELAQRHEKKSSSLQSTLEQLESQFEALERSKRNLEKRVEDLTAQVDESESVRQQLLEQKKKLDREILDMQERHHDEVAAAREDAERQRASLDTRNLEARYREEATSQIEKLEEQKRALQTAQRILQQDAEEKTRELANLDKQRKLLSSEVDDLRARLEAELVAKAEEQSARRKLQTELKENQLRYDAEVAKGAELAQSVDIFRQKADTATGRLEAAEIGKIKAEKAEGALRVQLKELEDSLGDLVKERRVAEEHTRVVEKQLADINDRLEEDQHEFSELQGTKRRLEEELARLQDRYRRDLDEQEANLDATRRKYAKELAQVMSELETEKNNLVRFKAVNKDLEDENDEMGAKLEEALRSAGLVLKEKERLEARVAEYTRLLEESNRSGEDHGSRLDSLMAQLRDLRLQLDESEAKSSSAERQLRQVNARLDDALDSRLADEKARVDLSKRATALEGENSRLRHEADEAQEIVEDVLAKLRKAELSAQEATTEVAKERESNQELERGKVALEAQIKELNARILDLEAVALADNSRGTNRLQARLEEQAQVLDREARERAELLKDKRQLERSVKDLQFQLAERDKTRSRQDEELGRLEAKNKEMRSRIEQLENAESNLELAKRRAEREANELRERTLRYEKDIERTRASRGSLSNLAL